MTTSAVVEKEYAEHVAALRGCEPELAAECGRFTGISSVLAWMQRSGLCRAAVDIVGQDEFHYDFLIQLQPGGRWIVFGVT
jgi:hypothetical protein